MKDQDLVFIVAGMGGSALAAELIRPVALRDFDVPFEVFKGYELPHYTDASTLVFLVSHSGNTEEDTEGCILLGLGRVFDARNHCQITGSRQAVKAFEDLVVPQITVGTPVYLEVE